VCRLHYSLYFFHWCCDIEIFVVFSTWSATIDNRNSHQYRMCRAVPYKVRHIFQRWFTPIYQRVYQFFWKLESVHSRSLLKLLLCSRITYEWEKISTKKKHAKRHIDYDTFSWWNLQYIRKRHINTTYSTVVCWFMCVCLNIFLFLCTVNVNIHSAKKYHVLLADIYCSD
jgi:hypothetical protein